MKTKVTDNLQREEIIRLAEEAGLEVHPTAEVFNNLVVLALDKRLEGCTSEMFDSLPWPESDFSDVTEYLYSEACEKHEELKQ